MNNWLTRLINCDVNVAREVVGYLIEFNDDTPHFCIPKKILLEHGKTIISMVRFMGYSDKTMASMRHPWAIERPTKRTATEWLNRNREVLKDIETGLQFIQDNLKCHPALKESVIHYCISDLAINKMVELTDLDWLNLARAFANAHVPHLDVDAPMDDLAGYLCKKDLDEKFAISVRNYVPLIRKFENVLDQMKKLAND